MQREYGIGRIPADADPIAERLANLEAAAMEPARVRRETRRCIICGAPAEMSASLGPTCADHYDDGE